MANFNWVLLFLATSWIGVSSTAITIHDPKTNLTSIASNYSQTNGSLIIFVTTAYLDLKSAVKFQGLDYVQIQGVNLDTTIKCLSGVSAGLIFIQTQHVEMKLLRFVDCGVVEEYNYRHVSFNRAEMVLFNSALHIVFSQHVHISNMSISNSQGTGLLLAYNSGHTEVHYSNFTGNRLYYRTGTAIGGGGVYLLIQNNLWGSQFLFQHCVFENNTADNTANYSYIFADQFGNPVKGRGRGGGIFVNIHNNVRANTVTLSHCNISSNMALVGGGLSVEIEGEGVGQNCVTVEHSHITGNGCAGSGSGGGAQISYRATLTNTNNSIRFEDVEFKANCAQLGGGAYFFSTLISTLRNTSNQLEFNQCRWLGNQAQSGAAVAVVPGIFDRQDRGYSSMTPVFRDCIFSRNSIAGQPSSERGNTQTYGTGILYSSLYDIKVESSVIYSCNRGSAVFIINAVLDLSESDALFDRNEGVQGGAIGMVGSSTILVGPHNYTFHQNMAVDRGGAIYSYLVDSHDFSISRSCFLQYSEHGQRIHRPSSEWNATITFAGNIARSRIGNDIFVSSLHPCLLTRRSNDTYNYVRLELAEIFQPPGVTFKNTVQGHSIASQGTRFSIRNGHLHAVPGERLLHGVSVLDELNQTISSTLIASFPSPAAGVEVASSSGCLTGHVIELVGKPHQSASLLLETPDPARTIFTHLDVEMLNCPPGFILTGKSCECDADSYTALLRCDNQELHSYRRPGFWVGYVPNSDGVEQLVSTICPWGFCKLPKETLNSTDQEIGLALPHNRVDLESVVCSPGRKGTLCGVCIPGYTVLFHSRSYNCSREAEHQCKLGPFYYFLSEILPATILFIAILIFNISFTSGALNGFILYSQVLDTLLVDASGVIKFPENSKIAFQVVKVIYGFFNLDFFDIESLSYCLWKNASLLSIVSFKYLTIGYSIFLIVLVLLFLRHCGSRCLGKYYRVTLMRNSIIQGLSAFLVICYSQCIKISFNLLYYSSLFQRPGANGFYPKRVWHSGDMLFFSSTHLPYALPALAVLLTIGVIPPLLLLTYPAIFQVLSCLKISGSCADKCLSFYSTIKPFLDAFQGSFKDRCRFFAGLYFMYRWVGVLPYAVIPHYTIFYHVVEVLLLLMLLAHAVLQPYINHWHNILDALLLANLILINRFTARNYYITRVDAGISYQANINKASVFQVILMYLPVLYLTGYLICSAIQQYIRSTFIRRQVARIIMD